MGSVSSSRRTGLVPLDRNPEARRGGVTSWVLREVCRAFLPGIMVESGEVMQDGVGPDCRHIIRDLLR
jgi:hypothetical protein